MSEPYRFVERGMGGRGISRHLGILADRQKTKKTKMSLGPLQLTVFPASLDNTPTKFPVGAAALLASRGLGLGMCVGGSCLL